MIFLTVGTWRSGYDRLVKATDELAGSGVITEEVIAQTGNGSYKPKDMTAMEFCSPDEFVDIISNARIIISHAGMGTILEALKQARPVVVVPRKSTLGEVDNEHQFATAKQLEKEGKILVAYEVNELPGKLKEAEDFNPAKGESSEGILHAVKEIIDNVAARKRA